MFKQIKVFNNFFVFHLQNFKGKIILVALSGFFMSFLQAFGILMLIPLLELYSGESNNKFIVWLEKSPIPITNNLAYLLLSYLCIIFFVSLFKALQNYYTQKTIAQFSNQTATDSIAIILTAKWEFFLEYSSSKLTNLMNAEVRSVRMLSFYTLSLLKNSLLMIVQLFFAFWVSYTITLFVILFLVILFISQQFFFKKNYSLGNKRINLSQEMQKFLKEIFSGIKELKLQAYEKDSTQAYQKRMQQVEQNELNKAKYDGLSDFVYTFIGAFILVVIVYLSLVYQWLDMPSLLVLILLFSRIITVANSVVKSISGINNQLPSFVLFQEIVTKAKAHQGVSIQSPIIKPIYQLELVDVSYQLNNKSILNGVNLSFKKGNFYILTGASGIGKTLTFDLISGLIQASSGEIKVNQQKVTTKELKNFQAGINYVLQHNILFGASIRDNICFFKSYPEVQLQEVVARSGLTQLIEQLPQGLDTLVNEDNRNLSGGEIQRIAIARALIHPPQMLILDEVSNALDYASEQQILAQLQELKKDCIVVLITHKTQLFDQADEVYHLN